MPYNGFEKYFIRETESRLASGYQSTEDASRVFSEKAPFSADAYHPNCPFIGQAKADRFWARPRRAFPTRRTSGKKSVAAIHPGIRNTAWQADHLGRRTGLTQRRELSQTFTAFPFNLTGRNPS